MQTIDADEMWNTIKEDTVTVVNVLSEEMYDSVHILGSINVPLDELKDGAWRKLDDEVIVYCASEECTASEKAARFLDEKGVAVRDYEGGMQDWAQQGLPVDGAKSREAFLEEGF